MRSGSTLVNDPVATIVNKPVSWFLWNNNTGHGINVIGAYTEATVTRPCYK
jgi:hypothetical protein